MWHLVLCFLYDLLKKQDNGSFETNKLTTPSPKSFHTKQKIMMHMNIYFTFFPPEMDDPETLERFLFPLNTKHMVFITVTFCLQINIF